MDKYPFLLCMPRADRNLGEIIQNERLAADELSVIKVVAMQLAKTVAGLHSEGVIHGDVKPRLVRAILFWLSHVADANHAAMAYASRRWLPHVCCCQHTHCSNVAANIRTHCQGSTGLVTYQRHSSASHSAHSLTSSKPIHQLHQT